MSSFKNQRSIRIAIFISIAYLSLYADVNKTRIIKDMAARSVSVPLIINTVYSTSPMGEIMLYTLAPEKIAGMTWTLDNEAKKLLLPEYVKKPVLGGWFGKNTTGNPEVIIQAHPDIVLSSGNLDNTDMSAARRIEEKLGIPVVMVNGELDSIDQAYRFMGSLFGIEERADTLADYCSNAISEVKKAVWNIPLTQRVRYYYAEGLNGLETDPDGSQHTEVFKMAGAINAADVPIISGYGRATVSFEQILLWQPQIILVCLDRGYAQGTGNYARIISGKSWSTIDAIRKGKVYQIPSLPFNWVDRPPSVNRIIGLKWLTNLLYPNFYKINIKEETCRFYELFYHRKITGDELDNILLNALSKINK